MNEETEVQLSPLEALEKKRADRKKSSAKAREDQYLIDLTALDKFEEDLGDGCVSSLSTDAYVAGCPTMVILKAPSEQYYKRFVQQVRKAGANLEARGAAQDMLADSCWIYPAEKDDRAKMIAAFPGILTSVAVEAAKLAELSGKG